MNRRQYLARSLAGTGLLAGCLALPDGGSTPTPRPTVTVVARDDRPAIPVRPGIEVVTPDATAAGPPALRATVRNTADHAVEVGEERAIGFAYVSSEAQPGLQLLPTDESYAPVEPGCWRLADAVAIAEYYGVVTLGPGESTARRVGVWATADAEGCLPRGQYRFETQYAGARDRGEGIEEQEWSGTWGFTLALE